MRRYQWKDLAFWQSSEWKKIRGFLTHCGPSVHPNTHLMFRPMVMTKPEDVKVVIIGTEPHAYLDGKTDGFAYSVPQFFEKTKKGYKYPTMQSTRFFTELKDDIKTVPAKHGSLLKLARQGVFLWNLHLTGIKGVEGAHSHWGWDVLTREVLEMIALENPKAVFVPWGLPGYGKNSIDEIVLKTSVIYRGPGPDSVVPGSWYGSKPFTKINSILKSMNVSPVNWNTNY